MQSQKPYVPAKFRPGPIPLKSPKLRVCWNGQERRFDTEAEAEAFADDLRKIGEKPCVCSH